MPSYPEEFESMLQRIAGNDPRLTALGLSHQKIDDHDAIRLAEALAQNTSLISLDLGNGKIGDAGAAALAKITSLKSLYLHSNQIGDAGAAAFAANTSLTLLDLGNNQIGDAGAAALAKSTSLKSLYLHNNQIGDTGTAAFTENTSLTSLDLGNNQIGDAGAIAFVKNTSLTSLGLNCNQIGDAGAIALAQITSLTSLELAKNKIRYESTAAFAQNTSLASLVLGDNQLSNDSAKVLAENTHLTSLDLGSNQIGDAGIIRLTKNQTLLNIDPGYNRPGYSKATKALVEKSLQRNRTQAKQFLMACKKGNLTKVKQYLDTKKVSPFCTEYDAINKKLKKTTGLHLAITHQKAAIVEYLTETYPQLLRFEDDAGFTPEQLRQKLDKPAEIAVAKKTTPTQTGWRRTAMVRFFKAATTPASRGCAVKSEAGGPPARHPFGSGPQ